MPDETFYEVTNAQIYRAVMQLKDDMRDLKNGQRNIESENIELRKRVRGLELKFYGILAGIVGAVSIFLANATGALR